MLLLYERRLGWNNMIRSYFIKNKLSFISILLLVVCASFFSYYITGETYTNLRVRKMKEIHLEKIDESINIHSMINYQDIIIQDNESTTSEKLLIINNKTLKLFYVIVLILSFYLFSLYIRDWIIQVSQSVNKVFMVHYLHRKDGKKNVLSFHYSF